MREWLIHGKRDWKSSGDVYGDAAVEGLKAYMESSDFGVEYAKWSTDFAFGTVWASDRLERKMRSLAVLG